MDDKERMESTEEETPETSPGLDTEATQEPEMRDDLNFGEQIIDGRDVDAYSDDELPTTSTDMTKEEMDERIFEE